MKRFSDFIESAAEMNRQRQIDGVERFKKEGQAAVQKTKDDAARRQMNAKKKALRDKMAKRGISDDDGLLDDED